MILPPPVLILSACITDVPELPVSNLPTIRPTGCIYTTSLYPHSLGTFFQVSLFSKCCTISLLKFLPVASSIPSVPGDEFTSITNGGYVSLFLLGIKSTAVHSPPTAFAAFRLSSISNSVNLIFLGSEPCDTLLIKSP